MVLSGSLWFLVVLVAFGGSCGFWRFLVVLGGSWRFLMVLGASWWFLVVFDGFWWFLMALGGS